MQQIDREKTLQAAQKYIEKKRYDRAIAEYQRIVQDDPNDARTLLKIGDLQARLSAYPEAIATYDRVGQYYSSQGFALKAIAVYKQIRELIKKHAPDLADRYGHIVPKLAEIYTQLGLTSDALAAYDEVATRLQRAGRDREAIEVFTKMVGLDAQNPLPHLRLAEARCRVQSLDEAIESFWTAAELLLTLERKDDALKVIERILHFKLDARYAWVAAELYLQRGTREDGLQALTKLQVCFQADPKNLDTLGLLAQAFTLIGQEAKAIEVYKEMARIARDGEKRELFERLLAHLRDVAPHDEQVRALQSLPPTLGNNSSRPPSASGSIAPLSVGDSEVEFIDETTERDALSVAPNASMPLPLSRPMMASAPDVVVVDEQLEAAEELADPSSFDARGHARKAVVDAESFRKLRLYPKAIEALHIALEIDPRSLEIRQKLRELLVESGDREGAIAETLNMASLQLDNGDVAQTEALIYEVLEIEPEHPEALAMLEHIAPAQIGYTEADDGRTRVQAPRDMAHSVDGYDPDAPLPSYDLEEIGAEQAMNSEPGRSFLQRPAFDVPDDPFEADQPLPSFPMGSEPDVREVSGRDLDDYEEEVLEVSNVEDFVPQAATIVTAPINGTEGLEDVLDEADFFATRGLYEDAKAILVEQLTRTPQHPLVLERLREIDTALGSSGESQTIERSQLGKSQAEEALDFDVAQSLGALDEMELPADSVAAFNAASDVDVDQVFEKFRAGIRSQVSENDSATHYDLGVAYKEMGLIADAIHEFELAARDAQRECNCFAMIGMVYLEQNQLDRAAESYVRALSAANKTVEQEMNLYYDLGTVYEMKGKSQDALYYFQKIARRDPGYRDIAERISGLQPEKEAPPVSSSARAVGDQDEFDSVFDDLFEGGGKSSR
ncbi:MAG TPA: tetratricopeptide repeat protein [Polyangiaceae bacterium]|nr:tetratricopeptide repeat protein [Polyangiaceae bacterium]